MISKGPYSGPCAYQGVGTDGLMPPVLVRLDMTLTHKLCNRSGKVVVVERVSKAHNITLSLLKVHALGQIADCFLVPFPRIEDRDGGNAKHTKILRGVIPGESIVAAIPDAEPIEERLQLGIVDAMAGPKVLAADAPPLGDVVADLSPELLHPCPVLSALAVKATGVHVVPVQGGVLPVHFLRHHNLPPHKVLNRMGNFIVGRDGLGPRQVEGPGIFGVFHRTSFAVAASAALLVYCSTLAGGWQPLSNQGAERGYLVGQTSGPIN